MTKSRRRNQGEGLLRLFLGVVWREDTCPSESLRTYVWYRSTIPTDRHWSVEYVPPVEAMSSLIREFLSLISTDIEHLWSILTLEDRSWRIPPGQSNKWTVERGQEETLPSFRVDGCRPLLAFLSWSNRYFGSSCGRTRLRIEVMLRQFYWNFWSIICPLRSCSNPFCLAATWWEC